MKHALKIEYLTLLILFGSFVYTHDFASWWLLLQFWAPDIAFIGYLSGPKIGAICYNLTHSYITGSTLFFVGVVANVPVLQYIGLVQLAHASFDRYLGYGLKYSTGFRDTHLGTIGDKK